MKPGRLGLSGRRVLVTGGTGFIGGRLVERLVLECDARVRVLVRNFAKVARIARFPIEMVQGDVAKPDDVERAVRGCELVFHLAVGTSGSKETCRLINVQGTENVLEASRIAGVKRVVHLSSLMVYGNTPDGDLDETAPRHSLGDVYSETKLESERVALRYFEKYGLPVVVLQPTAVYGPYCDTYGINILRQLKNGRVILVNGGDGLLNTVYIDDAVSAILLAGVKKTAIGEAFLISDDKPVTWRDFYHRFERMSGISGTVSMSVAEAELYYKEVQKNNKPKSILRESLSILRDEGLIRQRVARTREVAILRKLVKLILPAKIQETLKGRTSVNRATDHLRSAPGAAKPICPIAPWVLPFYASKTRVRIDKAKRILGYQPAFDFESGMRLTEQWVRWANLV